MSLVNHRTNNPGASDIYGYCLGTVPNQRTAQFPKGVTIDGSIMPVRDINDFNNGTNTWKELHGEDLYFIEEGSWERLLGCNQFGGIGSNLRTNKNGTFPNSWKSQYIQDEGYITSYAWRYSQGNWKASQIAPLNYYTCLSQCFSKWWLNISSETQLPQDIMSWPNGADVDDRIPNGYPHAGEYTSQYPEVLLGAALQVSDMTSNIDDFYVGAALSAEAVRKVYRDMEKLRYYVLSANTHPGGGSAPDGYHEVLSSFIDYIVPTAGEGNIPSTPVLYGSQLIREEQHRNWWVVWETMEGDFYLPFCGKYGGDPGSYNPMYGSEVAMYAWLRLHWYDTAGNQYDKYGLFKVPHVVYRIDGITFAYATDLVAAGYKLINKYNAEIPHQLLPQGQRELYTYVQVERLFSVCKVSDRTDTTQLNWNKRPQ